MKKNKHFMSGVLCGISIVIIINMLINSVSIVYKHYVSKEMSPKQKAEEIFKFVDTYYVNEYNENDLIEGMYAGIVSGLNDRYSYYMDKKTFTSFLESTEGTYAGIGTVVSIDKNDKKLTVITVYPDSPAEKSGIKEGDKILKINDFDVSEDNYVEAVEMMKGKKGTSVKLNIYRKSQDTTFDINVVRNDINIPTVGHKMVNDTTGYIMITQFDRVTYDQFVKAYNELNEKGMKELIIDLRGNPGGLLDVVVKISDMLIPKGFVTYVEDKNGKRTYEYSDDNYMNKPLVILVNENSASASEVLSGAVKDTNVGKLVGTTTYGKGVVQNIYKLNDGSGIKVTVAKYYTPSGVCIDGTGIVPDYVIEMNEDYIGTENDIQLKKAVEIVKDIKK